MLLQLGERGHIRLRHTPHNGGQRTAIVPSSTSSWQGIGKPDAPTWKLSGTEGTSAFWETSEAPLPPPKRVCNFIHPKRLSPCPERLGLPFPDGEILSGYEEDVSFIRDRVLLRG